MRLDPAYRKLQKLRDLVREQKVPSKIRDEIDEVLDLMKVSGKLYSFAGHLLDGESRGFHIFQNFYINLNFKR